MTENQSETESVFEGNGMRLEYMYGPLYEVMNESDFMIDHTDAIEAGDSKHKTLSSLIYASVMAVESGNREITVIQLRLLGRQICGMSDMGLGKLQTFATALNSLLSEKLSLKIRIPRVGEPTNAQWMDFSNGTNVASIENWGVIDQNGTALVKAEVTA